MCPYVSSNLARWIGAEYRRAGGVPSATLDRRYICPATVSLAAADLAVRRASWELLACVWVPAAPGQLAVCSASEQVARVWA